MTAAEMLDAYRGWCAVDRQKPIAQTALALKPPDGGSQLTAEAGPKGDEEAAVAPNKAKPDTTDIRKRKQPPCDL